jgi:hypothetical protein
VLLSEGDNVRSNDDELAALLASIDRRLALLSAREERELRRTLVSEILKTDSRIAMFDGIDGARSSAELGKLGGVGERSAQLFVKEMLELGFVREVSNAGTGRSVIVEKDGEAILSWYLNRGEGSE